MVTNGVGRRRVVSSPVHSFEVTGRYLRGVNRTSQNRTWNQNTTEPERSLEIQAGGPIEERLVLWDCIARWPDPPNICNGRTT